MIFKYIISTPKDTLETKKKKTVLKLGRGVIHQIDVLFPPGPKGLLHVHINRAAHQVWPTNPEANFAADDDKISFREHYEILSQPYQLEVYTWNLDDTFPHLLIIRLGMLRRKFILRRLF